MHKQPLPYLPQAVLVLAVVVAAGMLLASWRLVLYPSVVMFGVLMSLGLRREMRSAAVSIPAGIVALLLALFAVLDLMGLGDPSGEGLVLGLSPLTALYLFGIGAAFLAVGLLYGIVFPHLNSEGAEARSDRGALR